MLVLIDAGADAAHRKSGMLGGCDPHSSLTTLDKDQRAGWHGSISVVEMG